MRQDQPVNRQENMTGGVMTTLKFVVARGIQRLHRRGAPAGYYWT